MNALEAKERCIQGMTALKIVYHNITHQVNRVENREDKDMFVVYYGSLSERDIMMLVHDGYEVHDKETYYEINWINPELKAQERYMNMIKTREGKIKIPLNF